MVKDLQAELIPLLTSLENETLTNQSKIGIEQADTAYSCRETISMLEDLKTRINKVSTMANLVANHFMINRNLARIRTEYCTASPKPRFWFKITTKRDNDPDAHDLLQAFCGVIPEMAEKEVLRIHPPNFMDYLTERIGLGLPVPVDPKEVQKTEFGLSIRRKKDI